MDWKCLIVICSLVVIGHGKVSKKDFFLLFRDEMSKSLNKSLSFKDENSFKAMVFIHDLKQKEIFETMNGMLSGGPCDNLDQISKLYRNYSTSMKTIFQPLNFWISEVYHFMDNVDLQMKNLPENERYLDVYEPVQYFERVLDWLNGDCLSRLSTNKSETYLKSEGAGGDCGSESFLCGTGQCIDFNRTCDGSFDCWDGSDELGRCSDDTQCLGCEGLCTVGPREPLCAETCPPGFNYSFKTCKGLNNCYRVCYRGHRIKPLSPMCLIHILPNVLDSISDRIPELRDRTYGKFIDIIRETYMCQNLEVEELSWHTTTRRTTWHTTTHPTWRPTTRHPTWHPTTRHPTWHTTTHPTWRPTTKHPTWHPTTKHTTTHPTWHPTTRHPTWHTTTHPTWRPTTKHPTWHPTTKHTTTHPTWHPTTRHPTWHPTTRHTTWDPITSRPADSDEYDDEGNNRTPKHHTTRHTTKHTTHHTTKHTTPTTTRTTPTTPTTAKPTTTTSTTAKPTTTTSTTTTSQTTPLLQFEEEGWVYIY